MIEAQREHLSINKLVAEKKEIVFVETDMIVPDSKPDILNVISTSGIVSIYKKEALDGKVRIDGSINAYIMYMPDGTEDPVRGLNTNIDFSENIDIANSISGMDVISNVNIKNIEGKVINGRKIGIKATLEIEIKLYLNDDIEVINDVANEKNIQILKENLRVNSLVGRGETKIYAKENIPIESIDNLAEILKIEISIGDRDIKNSYNKILTKAELNVKIMYLTEDNRINTANYKIPVVGFIDMPNISEESICDINYEIKNIIIKPGTQEEHKIYVEAEFEVVCYAYENKEINLIQDMYSPTKDLNFEKRTILAMTDKQNIKNTEQIREKVKFNDIQGLDLLDVDIKIIPINENKINSKILNETELNLAFIFTDSKMNITVRETKIPFQYTIDNLENGETLNTTNYFEVKNKDFVVLDNGDINCNIDIETNTSMYRNSNINIIDNINELGDRNDQNYSIVIYIVKKGDTLWNIAKEFGTTVESIAMINNMENVNEVFPGQKLYIPKFERVLEKNYE